MFTGIIQEQFPISDIKASLNHIQYSIKFSNHLLKNLKLGASVAVDGVCQTVIKIDKQNVWFDAISETLSCTTLQKLQVNQLVNIERALSIGDEIGGHLLSGHVIGTTAIKKKENIGNAIILTLFSSKKWHKYLMPKGFIAIDGASLTIAQVNSDQGFFTVHLIPETSKRTTLGIKKKEDLVNIEIDPQTLTIVNTVEEYLKKSK